MPARTTLVPIAHGTEEMEAVTIIDTLRRADVDVTVASVAPTCQVTCSRGVQLVADTLLTEWAARPVDLIVLPGGMPGAANLHDCELLTTLLLAHQERDALLGAICAAPAVVLRPHGLIAGRRVTSHPAFFDQLDPALRSEDRVVRDGNLLTSRGPGTALEFALALVEALAGPAVRQEVAGPLLVLE